MKSWLRAHPDESALSSAIAVLLVAASIAAFIHSARRTDVAFSREEGSLRAPAAESGFSESVAAPSDPAAVAASEPGAAEPTPAPSPTKPPAPTPSPPGEPEPPTKGLLPDLPLIPPPPPGHGAR